MKERIIILSWYDISLWNPQSVLTFKNMEWNIVRDNYSNLDPFQNINMQAGVSNQVERVPGLYERKRTGDFRKLTKSQNFLTT